MKKSKQKVSTNCRTTLTVWSIISLIQLLDISIFFCYVHRAKVQNPLVSRNKILLPFRARGWMEVSHSVSVVDPTAFHFHFVIIVTFGKEAAAPSIGHMRKHLCLGPLMMLHVLVVVNSKSEILWAACALRSTRRLKLVFIFAYTRHMWWCYRTESADQVHEPTAMFSERQLNDLSILWLTYIYFKAHRTYEGWKPDFTCA